METVDDTLGRRLRITADFGTKTIFLTRLKEGQANVVVGTMNAKQALKLATILLTAVRHNIDPDGDTLY